MTAPHPEWPNMHFGTAHDKYLAALPRLRDAVQFISEIAESDDPTTHADLCECWSCEARALLARIGSLPE